MATLAKASELAPTFWMPHLFAANAYLDKGMYTEALAETRRASELPSTQTYSYALEVYILAKLGRQEEAAAARSNLLNRENIPPYHIAIAYAATGDVDKALDSLDRAFDQHDPKMTFLKVDAKWNTLRTHPRFI